MFIIRLLGKYHCPIISKNDLPMRFDGFKVHLGVLENIQLYSRNDGGNMCSIDWQVEQIYDEFLYLINSPHFGIVKNIAYSY